MSRNNDQHGNLHEMSLNELSYNEVNEINAFNEFVNQENFLTIMDSEDGKEEFKKLTEAIMKTNSENFYNHSIQHDKFLDIVKTKEGMAFFNALDHNYKKLIYSKNSFDQDILLDNMQKYITSEYLRRTDLKMGHEKEGNEEKKYVDALLEDLKVGHCAGFSYLYSIYKSRGEEAVFFNKLNVISQWDGESTLDEEKKQIFEEIVGHVMISQYEDVKGIIGTDKRSFQSSSFRISKILSPNITLLKYKESIYGKPDDVAGYLRSAPERIPITIVLEHIADRVGHATAMYKEDGKYFFYDPNNIQGEIVSNSPEEMIPHLNATCAIIQFNPEKTKIVFEEFASENYLLNKASDLFTQYEREPDVEKLDEIKALISLFMQNISYIHLDEYKKIMYRIFNSNLYKNDKSFFFDAYASTIPTLNDSEKISYLINLAASEGFLDLAYKIYIRSYRRNSVHYEINPDNEELALKILTWLVKDGLINEKRTFNFFEKNPEILNLKYVDIMRALPEPHSAFDSLEKDLEEIKVRVRASQQVSSKIDNSSAKESRKMGLDILEKAYNDLVILEHAAPATIKVVPIEARKATLADDIRRLNPLFMSITDEYKDFMVKILSSTKLDSGSKADFASNYITLIKQLDDDEQLHKALNLLAEAGIVQTAGNISAQEPNPSFKLGDVTRENNISQKARRTAPPIIPEFYREKTKMDQIDEIDEKIHPTLGKQKMANPEDLGHKRLKK